MRLLLSKIVSVLQMALLGLSLGGNFIPMIRDHPLYRQFQDKKMLIIIGGYFGLNMLQNMISSTGAF